MHHWKGIDAKIMKKLYNLKCWTTIFLFFVTTECNDLANSRLRFFQKQHKLSCRPKKSEKLHTDFKKMHEIGCWFFKFNVFGPQSTYFQSFIQEKYCIWNIVLWVIFVLILLMFNLFYQTIVFLESYDCLNFINHDAHVFFFGPRFICRLWVIFEGKNKVPIIVVHSTFWQRR